jgi:IMP dehydrogenase
MVDRLDLSYDDVLLKPQKSNISSRKDTSTQTEVIDGINLDIPILSAPMDTVTGHEMAQGMSDAGAIGVVHRYHGNRNKHTRIERVRMHKHEIQKIEGKVSGAIGITDEEEEHLRAQELVSAGADFLCLDVSHAHMNRCLNAVSSLSASFSTPIMVGNIATREAAEDLKNCGADAVKVGIGPGSHCKTRKVTGVGVPQISAVMQVSEQLSDTPVRVVCDGGIVSSGDIVKALAAGADSVMMGGEFAGMDEAPTKVIEKNGTKYKKSRGMASDETRKRHGLSTEYAQEGVTKLTEYQGSVKNKLTELRYGIQSGLSYCGAETIEQLQNESELIRCRRHH